MWTQRNDSGRVRDMNEFRDIDRSGLHRALWARTRGLGTKTQSSPYIMLSTPR